MQGKDEPSCLEGKNFHSCQSLKYILENTAHSVEITYSNLHRKN